MLALEIEACKPPRNDLKVAIVIETTNFYDASHFLGHSEGVYMLQFPTQA